jgi:hypothetical protein
MHDAEELAAELQELTVAVTCELHEAIEHLRQPGRFPPAGMPAAAVFDHPPGAEKPRHRSGAPSPETAALVAQAADVARERLGYGRRDDNPLLPALALAAFYLVEARRTDALGLRAAAGGRVVPGVVEPELASHEPAVVEGGAVLRTWFPVEGAPDACVQVRFPRMRQPA